MQSIHAIAAALLMGAPWRLKPPTETPVSIQASCSPATPSTVKPGRIW